VTENTIKAGTSGTDWSENLY